MTSQTMDDLAKRFAKRADEFQERMDQRRLFMNEMLLITNKAMTTVLEIRLNAYDSEAQARTELKKAILSIFKQLDSLQDKYHNSSDRDCNVLEKIMLVKSQYMEIIAESQEKVDDSEQQTD